MSVTTLAERVSTDFSKIKLKKAAVKVPKLKFRRKFSKSKKYPDIPISSIVNILIKAAVEKAKKDRKDKKTAEEEKSYRILEEGREFVINGGYGTASKSYGSSPHASYVDYGKLFGYLGKLKSQSMYENMNDHLGTLNKATESGSFVLADKETIEKGARYIRYFNSKSPIDKSSLVPIAGMSGAEWEEFKWFMRLETALYLLKISTS